MHINDFQEPPFFVKGSLGPRGQTIQVIGEDGEAHSFHVTEALALLECRTMRERRSDLDISTDEFAHAGQPLTGSINLIGSINPAASWEER